MPNRIQRVLPLLAVMGALAMLALIGLCSGYRGRMLRETSTAIRAVEEELVRLEEIRPASLDSADLRQALSGTLESQQVATVWLIDLDGRVAHAEGSTAASTPLRSSVQNLATVDAVRVLEAIPEEVLTDEQRLWVAAASAIRREGEHNDIYRHLLRPVRAADGTVIGMIGLAFATSDRQPGTLWTVGVLGILVSFLIYWLSLPLWVFFDAHSRGEPAWIWAIFVFIGNLVALLGYLLSRKEGPLPAEPTGSAGPTMGETAA